MTPASPSSSNMNDLCHHPSPFLLTLAIVLPIGCLFSYLPQHYKIAARKSHLGLNFFCYCGLTLTNCCTMVAFLLLHWDETFKCCHFPANTIAQCAYNTLRPIQFLVSFVCAAIIVVFYVVYFNQEEEARAHPTGSGETWWKIRWKISVLVLVCLCVGVSAAVVGNPNGISSGASSGSTDTNTQAHHNQISVNNGNASNTNASNAVDDFTSGLSICAAIITSVHWMPQVLETWRLQSLGSLSMALLVLQSFGCILTFVSVSKGGIMIGVPYLVASFMQFVLMGLSLMFWCRDRTKQDIDERGGLLQRLGSEEEEREEGYSACEGSFVGGV